MSHNAAMRAQALAEQRETKPLIGLPALMTMAYAGADLRPVGQRLLQRAQGDDAEALMDLCVLLQLQGDPDTALALQQQALLSQVHYRLLPTERRSDLKILALMAPGNLMTNTPLEFLAEGAGFEMHINYLVPGQPLPNNLQDYDLVINGVCELDRNRPTLEYLDRSLKSCHKPVLNPPQDIMSLPRDNTCRVLQGIPGLSMPITVRLLRPTLEAVAEGDRDISELLSDGGFPLIVRPMDSHGGHGLEKVDEPNALKDYLNRYPDQSFFVSRFVDYRGQDGRFRKYRVMLMDGKPYLAHMAVSEHWMVHYLNAGMAEHVSKRVEEARAMANFDQEFAAKHREALTTVQQQIGTHYIGMDCAETPEGDLLVFEVGTSMVVHAMDPVEVFPYKQPQMRKLFDGFLELLQYHA